MTSATAAAAAPTATTSPATGVGITVATLNGSANPGGDTTTGWFRYSTVDPGACNDSFGFRAPATGGTSLGSGNTPVPYSQAISGLASGTTYYFCAIASNSGGMSFGAVLSFTTTGPPRVITSPATNVTATSATLNGWVDPILGPTTGLFRYSTFHPGTCSDTFGTRVPTTGGAWVNPDGTFSAPVTGLTPATTYYFCAMASTSVGMVFGEVLSFTTLASPVVTTLAATGVGITVATLNGSANPRGDATTGWFRYSIANPGTCNDSFGSRAPATGGTSLGSGNTPVPYSQAISGLASGTTYYFCAIASNSVGMSFGAVLSFTTTGPPGVITLPATNVTATSATLNGWTNLGNIVWFRYSTVNPGTCNDVFGTRVPATVNPDGTFSAPVTGMSPAMTYYFCAIASNSGGMGFGAVLSLTTLAPPGVTTLAATGVGITVATLNGSANPRGDATTGWFRYSIANPGTCNDSFGSRAPATGGTSLGSGNTPVPYSQAISGLASGTTYYFCAIASNSVGMSFGAVLSFTTLAPPVVTTLAATGVTSTIATLNGSANPRLDATTGWFRYSTVDPGACNDSFGSRAPATGGISLGSGSTPVPYSQNISGLASGTTYYFCAIASNSVGMGFGAVLSFTTTDPPRAITLPATNVTATSATLNGRTNLGNIAWFRFSTVDPGSCSDTFGSRVPATVNPDGTFLAPVTGLVPATTYYFCAMASTSVGMVFGEVLSFTTLASPVVTTLAATGVGITVATLNGSANPRGDATTGWFRYSIANPGTCNDSFGSRAPATGGTSLGLGNTSVPYSQTIAGLASGTTYYFCAIVSNSVGMSLGAVLSFTTAAAPAVTTLPATNATSTSATLNGSANPSGDATTGWFRYSTVDPGACNDSFGARAPATGGTSLGSGSTAVSYSQAITSLASGTPYYFCAIVSNSVGMSFGAVLSFTTQAPPTVTTTLATAVASTTATLNGSANPMLDATRGWFRHDTVDPGTCNDTFGTRAPATGGTSLGAGASPAAYSEALSGLIPGATYYFCAIASNAAGTSFGAVLSFTTFGPPVVATSPPTGVTATSATLNGSANPRLVATVGWFRYDTVDPGACNDTFGTRAPATAGLDLGAGSSAVSFSQLITGLSPRTTHYACALAASSPGTAYGEVVTFTTGVAAPTVATQPASDIASTGATLVGLANPNGEAATGWFRLSTTSSGGPCNDSLGTSVPAAGALSLGAGTTATSYSAWADGLSPATTYYFCAAAANPGGAVFGDILSFTTSPDPPRVRTLPADLARGTQGTVTLNGAAVPNQVETNGWFRYGDTLPAACDDSFGARAPATGGTALGSGTQEAPFSRTLEGLPPGTYHYCAVAASAAGTSYGEVATFRVENTGCGCGAGPGAAHALLAAFLLIRIRRTQLRQRSADRSKRS